MSCTSTKHFSFRAFLVCTHSPSAPKGSPPPMPYYAASNQIHRFLICVIHIHTAKAALSSVFSPPSLKLRRARSVILNPKETIQHPKNNGKTSFLMNSVSNQSHHFHHTNTSYAEASEGKVSGSDRGISYSVPTARNTLF